MSGKPKINPYVPKSKSYTPPPIVEIYVDGAALGNPGYGGAGVVILERVNGDEFNELAHTLADLAAEEERDVTEDDIPAPIVTDGVKSTTLEALLQAAVSGEGILTLSAEADVVFASFQMADGDLTAWRSIGDIDLSDTSQSVFERLNTD